MATPLNELVRTATAAYLDALDMSNVPPPRQIEAELLEKVNRSITTDNLSRDKRDQLSTLKTLTHSQVADIMLKLHKICRVAPSDKNTDPDLDLLALYMTEGIDAGIYVTSDDTFRAVARQYNYSLTTGEFKEILASLKDAAPRRYRCTDRDLVPVNNGIFDYRTKELKPFDPDIVMLSKSHVDYVPGAVNPVIHNDEDGTDWDVESWMKELSDDPEIVELLWEITGAIIRPNVRWNKMALLYSEKGNNGKGTFCGMLRNVVGPTACASIPLADFGKDFLLEPLARASAVIVDENDVGIFLDKAANVKAVVTCDVISINRKFKTPIAYQFCGFMVQCVNDLPRFKDKSDSIYRRQLVIPFLKNFKGVERRYIKDDYLNRPEVLQYVLHRVLHMDYYVLSEPQAVLDALETFKENNDPIRSFWSEFSDQFVWDLLPFSFLYDLYKSWFSRSNPSGVPVSNKAFVNDIINIVDDDDTWYCADKSAKIRPAGRMDETELLIARYDLTDWTNPGYPGKDPALRSKPMLSASYRGLLRHAGGPALLATGTDDSAFDSAFDTED